MVECGLRIVSVNKLEDLDACLDVLAADCIAGTLPAKCTKL